MARRKPQCEEAELWMQKALDCALTPSERETLDRHMEGCPACTDLWQQHRSLSRLATGWARRPSLRDDLADRFVAELLTRIQSRPTRRLWSMRPRMFSLAAGALALLAVFSWFLARSVPALPAFPSTAAISSLAIPPSPSPVLPHGGIDSLKEWFIQGAQSVPSASADVWNALTSAPIAAMPALIALAIGLLFAAVLATQTIPRRRLPQ